MADIDIVLKANSKDAERALKDFATQATSSLQSVESAFGFLKTAAIAAVGVIVSGKLIGALQDAAEAASEQEKAFNAMNVAMAAAGRYSKDASSAFNDFASNVQKTTGLSDDLIMSQIGIAQNFARSNEEAKKLVEAAIQLSAATGGDLNSSVEALGKTLTGTEGSLGKMLPAVKGLTVAQLKHGEAIDFVLSRFGGVAEAQMNTFSGAILASKNSFDDLNEAVGDTIIKNPVLIEIIKKAAKIIETMKDMVEKNHGAIVSWMNKGIKLLVSTLPHVVTAIRAVLIIVEALINGFIFIETVVENVVKAFMHMGDTVTGVIGTAFNGAMALATAGIQEFLGLLNKIPGVSKAFSAMGFDIDGTMQNLDETVTKFTAGAVKSFDEMSASLDLANPFERIQNVHTVFEGIDKATIVARNSLQEYSDSVQLMGDAHVDASKKALEALDAQAKATEKLMSLEEQRAKTLDGTQNPLLTTDQANALFDPIRFQEGSGAPAAIGQMAGLLGNALKGAEGAVSVISTTLGKIADTLLPGIGGVVTEIVKVLAQGPEKVKEFFTQFFDAIPDIIIAIIESIPVIIEVLIDKLPDMIERLITKLIEKLPKIIEKLVVAGFKLAIASMIGFVTAALLNGAKGWLPQFLSDFGNKINESLSALFNGINNFLSQIMSGAGQFVSKILEGAVQFVGKILEGAAKVALALVAAAIALPVKILEGIAPFAQKILEGAIQFVAQIVQGAFQFVAEILKGPIQFIAQIVGGAAQFIGEIVKGAIQFGAKILESAFNFLGQIAQGAGQFVAEILRGAVSFIGEIIKGAGNFIGEILNGAGRFIEEIVNSIGRALDELNPFNKSGGARVGSDEEGGITIGGRQSGGGVGVGSGNTGITIGPDEASISIGGIGIRLWEKGGMVPPGFENDSFFAGLSSGEMVIPADDVARLHNFLSENQMGQRQLSSKAVQSGEENKQLTINLVVGERELANVMLDLNRRGFRTA